MICLLIYMKSKIYYNYIRFSDSIKERFEKSLSKLPEVKSQQKKIKKYTYVTQI